jgi:Flp pilus assembly protein protease CpaA
MKMQFPNKTTLMVSWGCRIAPESVYIFTKVGMEPWGRYGSGVAELIASMLLLSPCYAWAGALLALGVMGGAIVSHLTVLGIVVQDDGGLLFGLALAVAVCSLITLILHRSQIPYFSRWFKANAE